MLTMMDLAMVDLYGTNPGPIDGSILFDQDKHVSSAVWDGQERGALRCHEHTSKLDQWTLTVKQIELVEKAGFGFLRLIPAISLDNPLISALVERWRRETNTFHLNVGEMTVTLNDVALLLGLAIDGEPVIGLTYTTCHSVCQKYLGLAPDSGYTSGGMVKLSWLKEFFSQCPEDAAMEVVECHTRAYLLYLVGSTIFSTTTGNKVPVMYLPLFENFDHCGKYAWGAATLAFLYRALGNASLRTQSTISGCLTLLQCWSYFHLNIGRPKLNYDPMYNRFPFVLRWKGKQSGPTTNRDVVFYRKALDSLKPCDVDWLPYQDMDSTLIPEDIRSTLILGRARTMLLCFDKAERHLPNRCLRQYGIPQAIPEDVPQWERKSRGVDGGIDLSGKMESELGEWLERGIHIVDGNDALDENEYMQWYLKITRRFVGRPISLSSEFQRTNAGLRDIAHIADTFSTKGLDPQQIESISKIKSIAHECLRDQVGGPVMMSATPELELGKRIRGKERVRRKGTGKRMRKEEQLQYSAASEDGQSQFCDSAIEIDQIELHSVDGELNHSHICPVNSQINDLQLIRAANEGGHMQLCHGIEVDHAKLSQVVIAGHMAELSQTDIKIDEATIYGIPKDVNSAQLYDAMEEVNNSDICDEIKDVIDSPYCDVTKVDKDSPQYEASEDITIQQLSGMDNGIDSLEMCEAADGRASQMGKPIVEIIPESSIETLEDITKKSDFNVVI